MRRPYASLVWGLRTSYIAARIRLAKWEEAFHSVRLAMLSNTVSDKEKLLLYLCLNLSKKRGEKS